MLQCWTFLFIVMYTCDKHSDYVTKSCGNGLLPFIANENWFGYRFLIFMFTLVIAFSLTSEVIAFTVAVASKNTMAASNEIWNHRHLF